MSMRAHTQACVHRQSICVRILKACACIPKYAYVDILKPQPRNRQAKKQSRKENPNSNNWHAYKHKGNYKTNLGKHINTKQDKENKIKTKKKDRNEKGSKNEYLKAKSSQA